MGHNNTVNYKLYHHLFQRSNIYKLQDVAASEIKPQEKYFSISYTHRFRKSECQIYEN